MNIVIITDDFYPNYGGIAHTLKNLYEFLHYKGHKLYIFNPYSRGKDIFKLISEKEYYIKELISLSFSKNFLYYIISSLWIIFQDNNIPFSHRLKIILYLFTKRKRFFWIFDNVTRLYPFLQKLDFQIIMYANSKSILQITFILSKLLKKKIITMAHGKDFLDNSFISSKSNYFRYSDKVILSCTIMKELIKKVHHLDESKLDVINRGINLKDYEIIKSKNELRQEFKISQDSFILLSVGRHIPRKDFGIAIKAIDRIKQLRPSLNIKYFLIGEGKETKNLKELVKNLKLENEITFLGACDVNKRNRFYKLSDVFLMPARKLKNDIEGFGIVFLEANFYKIPVLGNSIGGVREAILNGDTGFLVEPDNLNDLVEKMLYLYCNEVKRKEMGEKGHIRVNQKFSWKKIVNDYIQTFKSLI